MKRFIPTIVITLATTFVQANARDLNQISFKDITGSPINIDSIYAVKGDTVYAYVNVSLYSSIDTFAYKSINVLPTVIDYSHVPGFLINKVKLEDDAYMSSLRKSTIDKNTTKDYIKTLNAYNDSIKLSIAKKEMADRRISFENPKTKLDPPTKHHINSKTYEYSYTDSEGNTHTSTSIIFIDDRNSSIKVNTYWDDGSISRSR